MDDPVHANNSKSNDELVEERRKFVRLNINVDIQYSILSHHPQKQIALSTASKNIGAGGICVLTLKELKIGDILKLDIRLPEIPPDIHAIGKVAWIKNFTIATEQNKRYDVGIQFIEISEEDKKRINKYVFSLK